MQNTGYLPGKDIQGWICKGLALFICFCSFYTGACYDICMNYTFRQRDKMITDWNIHIGVPSRDEADIYQ